MLSDLRNKKSAVSTRQPIVFYAFKLFCSCAAEKAAECAYDVKIRKAEEEVEEISNLLAVEEFIKHAGKSIEKKVEYCCECFSNSSEYCVFGTNINLVN